MSSHYMLRLLIKRLKDIKKQLTNHHLFKDNSMPCTAITLLAYPMISLVKCTTGIYCFTDVLPIESTM